MNVATKLLIISDSHGSFEHINLSILKERPKLILHLGDGMFDFNRIQSEFPEIPALGVKGNCDLGSNEPISREINVEGIKIFMAHGHIYDVKHGYATAIELASSLSADILLFGHTHHALYEMSGGLHVMNPGSIREGCYGVVELVGGSPFCRLKRIQY